MPKPQTYGLGALIRKERQEKEQGLTPPEPTPAEHGRPPDSMVGVHVNSDETPAPDIIGHPPQNIADAHQLEQRTPTNIKIAPTVDGVGGHRQDADPTRRKIEFLWTPASPPKIGAGVPPKNNLSARPETVTGRILVRHAIRLDPTISNLQRLCARGLDISGVRRICGRPLD